MDIRTMDSQINMDESVALQSPLSAKFSNCHQLAVPHFEELERQNPTRSKEGMREEIYSQALDYLVIACVDLVFTHNNQILLAKRKRFPRPSWWVIGGRMIAGENPLDTAVRKAAQEASLNDVDKSRFQYIGTYSTCFAFRHQMPIHHGLHSLNITYQVALTNSEKEQLVLDADEYQSWDWFEINEINFLLDSNNVMDQALLRVIDDLNWIFV